MKNIKETINKIQELRNWNSYVNKERFVFYAEAKYSMTNREAESLWRVWDYIITLNWYKLQDELEETVEMAVSVAREVYESVSKGAHIHWRENKAKTPKWRLYYRCIDNRRLLQMDVDLRNKEDAIKYGLLLQRGDIEIMHRLDFYERVETRCGADRKKIDIYEGDIIFCSDTERFSFTDNSGAYICDDGCYKRLMYTKGRGYICRGNPDFEQDRDGCDRRYSSYVFNMYDYKFQVVGNIYIDNSVLSEKKEEL